MLKQYIESIFKKKTGYAEPEHAIDQAESLKSLSIDLYTDPKRFVYELLQNADDSVLLNNSVNVGIRLFDDFLVVAHTGKPFDKRDLRGICGVSDGTKKKLIEKTGYKGIGFKAVFGQSQKVTIYTKGEYFRFDGEYNFPWNAQWGDNQKDWEDENERQFLYPWQIIPIYTYRQEVDERIHAFLEGGEWTVATIVLLSKGKNGVKRAIEQLSSNINMFLFLKNIEKLDFNLGTPNIITLHRAQNGRAVGIKENGNIKASWILKKVNLKVPLNVQSKLQEERNIPEKLLHANETELTFAAKIGEDGIQELDSNERLLYSYLPTEETKYAIPVLVNSSFVIGANRESLHEDSKWNQWLFENIPSELLKWIAELVKGEFEHQAYELIPANLIISNTLGSAYRKGLAKALETIPFILSNQQNLIRVSQAIIDFTSFSKKEFITESVIREYVVNKLNRRTIHSNPFLPYTIFRNKLKSIGVACFEWDDVSKLMESDVFRKNHSSFQNIELVQYLKYLSEADKPERITDTVIKKWSFLLDHKNNLHHPTNIYFPTPDDNNWNESGGEISFLHGDVQQFLLRKPEVRAWLGRLGVVEKTDLSYLRKTIIENASSYSTHENAIPTIQNIFNLYINRKIGKEELNKLSELKLLTQKGKLLPSKSCYFSDNYSPRLKLEAVIPDDIFVSYDYINGSSENKEEWRRFFKMMGVSEGISVVKYSKESSINLNKQFSFQNEYFQQDDKTFKPFTNLFRADTYSDLVKPLFLSQTQSFEFSKLFWEDLIEHTEISQIDSLATAYWGYEDFPGRNTGNKVGNYLKWYVRNNPCIPTLECICVKSTNVFLNSKDIIDISDKYLPVFLYGKELSPDWKSFFSFKTSLELPDYLQLLQNIVADKTEKGTTRIENNERIQNIYRWLLDSCVNFNNEQIALIKEWSNESYLPDKRGYTFKCYELNYFIDGDASIFQGEFTFIFLNASNRKHKSLGLFLELFNIRILRQNEFRLNSSEIKELLGLQNRLKIIFPYLLRWLDKTVQDNSIEKKSKLKDKVEKLKIFSSESLEITYGNWSKRVQVHFDNNILHVTNPWNSNKVMINLSEQLCQYLEIKGYEKELDFLLRVENTQEIDDYFSQENIELPPSHGIVSFDKIAVAKEHITLTPDILASAGISTQAELEERLKDPTFTSMFIHSSTSSYSMLKYALEKIERAKRNIVAYLNTLSEYDCRNSEEVSNSIIGGIEKNGEEIFIVIRPSDNNEVIIYYQAEFDTLEYAESELWYENGIDEPEKLTLGRILKVTGFNRIPV